MATRVVSGAIRLDPPAEKEVSKYITRVDSNGITIHPEVWSNSSSYIQLNGTGMELFNSSGISIAQYGASTRIGRSSEKNIFISSENVQIRNSSLPMMSLDGTGMELFNSSRISIAQFGTSTRIGQNSRKNIFIDSGNVQIRNGSLPIMNLDNNSLDFNVIDVNNNTYTTVATFGESTQIGRIGLTHITIDEDSIEFWNGTDRIGYIALTSSLFPTLHVTDSLQLMSNYVWRKTPDGALGLYWK